MKSALVLATLFFFSFFNYNSNAQSNGIPEGGLATVYSDIASFEAMIAQKTETVATYLQLADAYYLTNNYEKAITHYEQYLKLQDFSIPQSYYRYSKALEKEQHYVKAVEMYKAAERLNNTVLASSSYRNTDGINMLSVSYQISEFEVNSRASDFAPSFYRDQIVFSSDREDKGKARNSIDPWTGKPYRNLYRSAKDRAGKHSGVVPFVIDHVKGLRGSTTAFTQDGFTVYFTKEVHVDRKRGGNTTVLKIYKASFLQGKWKDITELPFNGALFSTAHPALNADESKLYFASDRDGRKGVSDLYVVDINNNGMTYGDPIKLGPEINTDGKDTFPFVSKTGKLYFSSDGHPGLGGMDVFVADLMGAKNQKVKVYNLGEPINSALDDFTFIIDETSRSGYFCSNRRKGAGKDDIFNFVVKDNISLVK